MRMSSLRCLELEFDYSKTKREKFVNFIECILKMEKLIDVGIEAYPESYKNAFLNLVNTDIDVAAACERRRLRF